MAFDKWRTVIESIGLVALIGSLLFVGVQIKQERAIAESELSYARNELFVSRFSAALSSDAYLGAYAKLYASHDWPTGDLTDKEIAAAEIDAMLWWAYLETTFWHRQHGLVDEAEWSNWNRNVRWAAQDLSPVFEAVFEKFWLPAPSDFTRAVQRIQTESPRATRAPGAVTPR